jgi:hypothetical protein
MTILLRYFRWPALVLYLLVSAFWLLYVPWVFRVSGQPNFASDAGYSWVWLPPKSAPSGDIWDRAAAIIARQSSGDVGDQAKIPQPPPGYILDSKPAVPQAATAPRSYTASEVEFASPPLLARNFKRILAHEAITAFVAFGIFALFLFAHRLLAAYRYIASRFLPHHFRWPIIAVWALVSGFWLLYVPLVQGVVALHPAGRSWVWKSQDWHYGVRPYYALIGMHEAATFLIAVAAYSICMTIYCSGFATATAPVPGYAMPDQKRATSNASGEPTRH